MAKHAARPGINTFTQIMMRNGMTKNLAHAIWCAGIII